MAGEMAAAQAAAANVDTAIEALRTAVAAYSGAVNAARVAGALTEHAAGELRSNWALGALVGHLGAGVVGGLPPGPGAGPTISSYFGAPSMPTGANFSGVIASRLR